MDEDKFKEIMDEILQEDQPAKITKELTKYFTDIFGMDVRAEYLDNFIWLFMLNDKVRIRIADEACYYVPMDFTIEEYEEQYDFSLDDLPPKEQKKALCEILVTAIQDVCPSIGLIEFFDNICFNSMLTEQELDKLREKVLDEHIGSFLSNMNILISDPFEIIDCGNSYEDCINNIKKAIVKGENK